jgi:general secretion pathway protein A
MYKNFYKLRLNPFGNSPDPRFLYMMPHTREALAALEFGIGARRGFIVLTGEAGTGKTTLLRKTIESFDPAKILTSFIFNPRLEVLDFLEFVMNDFGITPTARTKSSMLLQLNQWLIERFRNGQTCVIVVDEAQTLSSELLEEIRLLANLETSSDKLLQIVMSGQPEFEEKLRHPSLRQLRQRIALWCRVQALTEIETAQYIERRLITAGSLPTIQRNAETATFARETIGPIHRASRGVPRIVNLICEHSLIFGYVEHLNQITVGIVQDVIEDLDLSSMSFSDSLPQPASAANPESKRAPHVTSPDSRFELDPESGRAR